MIGVHAAIALAVATGSATKPTSPAGRVPSRSVQYGKRVGEMPFLVAKEWRSGPTPETHATPRALPPPSNASPGRCLPSRFALTLLLAANLDGRTGVKRTPLADGLLSINWRGRPLCSYETVINLSSNTTNLGGLVVRARLDRRRYPIGKKVSPAEIKELNIEPDDFHGDWNYVIRPRPKPR